MADSENFWKSLSDNDDVVYRANNLILSHLTPSSQGNDEGDGSCSERLDSPDFEREASVRRSVTVHCRQILNPDGSILVSKHLEVGSATLPRSAAELPAVLLMRKSHEGSTTAADMSDDLHVAQVCAIVLNESLRPKASAFDDSRNSPGRASCMSNMSSSSGSSIRSRANSGCPDLGANYSLKHNTQTSTSNRSSYTFPKEEKLYACLPVMHYKTNQPFNQGKPEKTFDRFSPQNDRDRSRNGGQFDDGLEVTDIETTFSSHRARRPTWSTLPRPAQPMPTQRLNSDSSILYNSYFKPFYRTYSHEVFKHAPKLASFDSDAFDKGSTSAECFSDGSTAFERPMYFIDMKNVSYGHDAAPCGETGDCEENS